MLAGGYLAIVSKTTNFASWDFEFELFSVLLAMMVTGDLIAAKGAERTRVTNAVVKTKQWGLPRNNKINRKRKTKIYHQL